MSKDEKYVVVKKENVVGRGTTQTPFMLLAGDVLEDAVVIRTGDVFAGPALHAYASNIQVAVSILAEHRPDVDLAGMRAAADYFHERAEEADELAASRSVKTPD